MQEIKQQLEEISIVLKNHIKSTSNKEFNEFYKHWLNKHYHLIHQCHDLERIIEYWGTNFKLLNACIAKHQIIQKKSCIQNYSMRSKLS